MGRTSDARERLMDAIIALISEGSYGCVTIDDICRRADVRKGSFYYFFPGKQELTVAALDSWWDQNLRPNLDRQFSASIEPLMRIQGYLEAAYQQQLEFHRDLGKVLGCTVFSVGCELGTTDDQVCSRIRELSERKLRYFEGAIRDAVARGHIETCDPARKAACLGGLIEGTVGRARLMNDPEVMRELPAMAADLLRVVSPAK